MTINWGRRALHTAPSTRCEAWPSPTDSCSTPSAGCRSSIRRSWLASWAKPHATIHRALTGLLADGIGEAAGFLGFVSPSDFVRAYPMSREWLTLLILRMDAVASVYRLAASMSLGNDGLRSRVEFHRRGRFDATITLHNGRSFGVSCARACPCGAGSSTNGCGP